MIQQTSPVVPPVANDGGLKNFSQNVQSNLYPLFQAAHVHKVVTAAPKANDGTVGDIYIFDNGASIYIYIKTPRGWARSTAFTLI